MSYRSIALASSLLLLGCGSAATTASKGAEAPPGDVAKAGGSAAAASASPGEGASTPHSPEVPAEATKAEEKPEKSIGQAVVETKEPLAGKLSDDDIRRILEKNGALFGDCYTLGAGGKTKDFRAVVTVKATLGPTGNVNSVEVKKSSNNIKVDACVAEAFKKIKFPKPQGGTSVITFPINFGGVEQVN